MPKGFARKPGLALVMLFLMQGIAFASTVSVYVATGAGSGSTSPTGVLGYKTSPVPVTITAGTNYTLDYIKNNNVTVTSGITGTGPWSYTVPLKSSPQTVYVYFKTLPPTPTLIARLPSIIYTTINTPATISGSSSTILNLQPGTKAKFKFTSTSAPVFAPISSSVTSPADINTQFTASSAGNYTATMILTAPGALPSSANITVTVQPPGVAASSFCLSCHNGSIQANSYGSSIHAASTQGPTCDSCHNPGLALPHPGTVDSSTVSPTTFTLTGPANGYPLGSNFCAQCHSTANEIVSKHSASPHTQRANGPATCAACHVDAHAVASTTTSCVGCHADSSGNVIGHPIAIGTNPCTVCHDPHSTFAAGCDGCHDCPPPTAAHSKHYSGTLAQAGYGDTRTTKDFGPNATGYIMNCGNCHPMNSAKHRNGTLEVELYNPQAPAGSLKALSPSTAAYAPGSTVFTDTRGYTYTKGTCSNIYCHSYTEWTTTTLIPEMDPDWQSKVVAERKYATPGWGDSITCSGCHAVPPRTSAPANDGGAGDSHSYIDMYGYDNLHTYNMLGEPISCKYCHIDTVQQINSYTFDTNGIAVLGAVPISNFSNHVNGRNDVAFDRQNPFVYKSTWTGQTTSMSLGSASYDAATKTCSNVSCHLNQTTVKWGTPYRYNSSYECNVCHQM